MSEKAVTASALNNSPCTHTAAKFGVQVHEPTFFTRHILVKTLPTYIWVPSGIVSISKLARKQAALPVPPEDGSSVGEGVAVGGVPVAVGVLVGKDVLVAVGCSTVAVGVGEAAGAVPVRLWE